MTQELNFAIPKSVVVLSVMLALLGGLSTGIAATTDVAAGDSLEQISAGDSAAQRHRAWMLLKALTHKKSGTPSFTGWYSEAEVFAAAGPEADGARLPFPGLPIGAGAAPSMRLQHFADAPVITFVHYDQQAYRHIRKHQLYQETRLQEIAESGDLDPDFVGMKTIPLLPVWDPRFVRHDGGAIDYPSWRRIVLLGASAPVTRWSFAGRVFLSPNRVDRSRFFHFTVDAALATALEADPGARKAATLVLGRPLKAGDGLVLVAFHLLTTDHAKGIWTTFWWHDLPDGGRFGNDRPRLIEKPWKNYLMDVATDAILPREADGSPRICFNPWFEARFPGARQASGIYSNCINCHIRASYPKTAFLPIRRGAPDKQEDPAFAPGRVRTGLLWSLANPAQAGD